MKNKYLEDCIFDGKLEGSEWYITPKAFLCDICADLVLRDKQAVLVMCSYIDTTFPVFFPDQEEEKSLKFIRCCSKCGNDL